MESSKLVERAAAAVAVVGPYLPPEIIFSHVLVCLPVRILFKLCCVSKQWHTLITDPIFRASYQSRSKQNPRILLKYYAIFDGISCCRFSSLDYKDGKLVGPVSSRFKITDKYLFAVPCLDLVCLCDYKRAYIWNPATGEHIKLPKYGTGRNTDYDSQEVAFGYYQLPNSTSKTYKLLHFQDDYPGNLCGEVLTLGSDQQWKEINGPPFGRYQRMSTCCFHGAAYIVGEDRRIARFDLEREEWTLIEGPKPEELSRRPRSVLTLTELGGLLCLIDYDMSAETTIWFLEDPIKGIWAWKYNIDVSPLCAGPGPGLHKAVVPLVLEKDGRVLIHIRHTNTLYYYEPRTKNFEATYFYRGSWVASVHVYIESFKSLKF